MSSPAYNLDSSGSSFRISLPNLPRRDSSKVSVISSSTTTSSVGLKEADFSGKVAQDLGDVCEKLDELPGGRGKKNNVLPIGAGGALGAGLVPLVNTLFAGWGRK